MEKYIIEWGKTAPIKAELGYEDMRLNVVFILNPLELTDKHYEFFWSKVPITEDELLGMKESAKFKITTVAQDLSFKAFWDAYNYKVGKKKRAERLWSVMKDADRAKCLKKIPEYEFFLAHKKSQDKLYPETFLYNGCWDNIYKTK